MQRNFNNKFPSINNVFEFSCDIRRDYDVMNGSANLPQSSDQMIITEASGSVHCEKTNSFANYTEVPPLRNESCDGELSTKSSSPEPDMTIGSVTDANGGGRRRKAQPVKLCHQVVPNDSAAQKTADESEQESRLVVDEDGYMDYEDEEDDSVMEECEPPVPWTALAADADKTSTAPAAAAEAPYAPIPRADTAKGGQRYVPNPLLGAALGTPTKEKDGGEGKVAELKDMSAPAPNKQPVEENTPHSPAAEDSRVVNGAAVVPDAVPVTVNVSLTSNGNISDISPTDFSPRTRSSSSGSTAFASSVCQPVLPAASSVPNFPFGFPLPLPLMHSMMQFPRLQLPPTSTGLPAAVANLFNTAASSVFSTAASSVAHAASRPVSVTAGNAGGRAAGKVEGLPSLPGLSMPGVKMEQEEEIAAALGTRPCQYCGKQFKRDKNLERHIAEDHQGARPIVPGSSKGYACALCPYTSSHYSNLYVHMRVHTGEKPYYCGACGHRSSQGSTLKMHIKTRHCGNNKEYYNLDGNARIRLAHLGKRPDNMEVMAPILNGRCITDPKLLDPEQGQLAEAKSGKSANRQTRPPPHLPHMPHFPLRMPGMLPMPFGMPHLPMMPHIPMPMANAGFSALNLPGAVATTLPTSASSSPAPSTPQHAQQHTPTNSSADTPLNLKKEPVESATTPAVSSSQVRPPHLPAHMQLPFPLPNLASPALGMPLLPVSVLNTPLPTVRGFTNGSPAPTDKSATADAAAMPSDSNGSAAAGGEDSGRGRCSGDEKCSHVKDVVKARDDLSAVRTQLEVLRAELSALKDQVGDSEGSLQKLRTNVLSLLRVICPNLTQKEANLTPSNPRVDALLAHVLLSSLASAGLPRSGARD